MHLHTEDAIAADALWLMYQAGRLPVQIDKVACILFSDFIIARYPIR